MRKWAIVCLVIEGTDKEIQDFYVRMRDLNEYITSSFALDLARILSL